MPIRRLLSMTALCVGFIMAAMLGAVAAAALVAWRYTVALEQLRRLRPQAALCPYDYTTWAMFLVPWGALAGITIAEILRQAWTKRAKP